MKTLYKMKSNKSIERVYKNFGGKVRRFRTFHGLTQEQLARRTGLSRTSIANIEVGRQRVLLNDVRNFAIALRIKPNILLRNVW